MVGDFNPILDGGEFEFLTLVPSEGGTKKWKIQKLILEPNSQNMICCKHKNKTERPPSPMLHLIGLIFT